MKKWYCIHTKAGYEDQLSQRLMNVPDIDIFLPKLKRKKYLRGKLGEVTEKLFPCYIFLRFDSLKYLHLIKYTRGVRRIVGDGLGNPYIVDDVLIGQIKSRTKDGFIYTEQIELEEGDRVVVREGPLKGFTGILQEYRNSRDRVLVLLSAITYQASIEVEKEYVVKA